ncbi:MAG: HNH endonuclease [Desulfocapsaceae bacterium]|nr:HNH endonuclease [Desulfocapsaceae bacterium]
MAISDKNRKILWAKSGNRCAICRHGLVVDETEKDSESVVGDECHIVSGAKDGPRHDPDYPAADIDSLSNLMLLCRVHHKMVDDQVETYTADVMRVIKSNHEKWVETKLQDHPQIPSISIKRISNEIPKQLPAIQSGKELLSLAIGCQGAYHDYSEGLNDEETELVGSFIQNVSDWGDIGDGMEPIERIRAAKAIDGEIAELKSKGFMVFAARERQCMEGGVNPPSSFYVLHLSVCRVDDPNVVRRESGHS